MTELLKTFEFPEQCNNCPALREYVENKVFIESAELPQDEVDRRMREDLIELEESIKELSQEAFQRPCAGAFRTIYGNRGRGQVDLGFNICSIIRDDTGEVF